MAIGMPARCKHCGLDFVSNAMMLDNVSNVTINDVQTNCPRCGEWANIADGVFSSVADVLTVVSSPDIDKEMIRALAPLLKIAVKNEDWPDTLVNAAKEMSPRLGDMIERTSQKPHAIRRIAYAAILLLLAKSTININIDIDVNELIQQLSRPGFIEKLL